MFDRHINEHSVAYPVPWNVFGLACAAPLTKPEATLDKTAITVRTLMSACSAQYVGLSFPLTSPWDQRLIDHRSTFDTCQFPRILDRPCLSRIFRFSPNEHFRQSMCPSLSPHALALKLCSSGCKMSSLIHNMRLIALPVPDRLFPPSIL